MNTSVDIIPRKLSRLSVYVAAPFVRRKQARKLADRMTQSGICVTSSWVYPREDIDEDAVNAGAAPEQAVLCAQTDLRDLTAANTLVQLNYKNQGVGAHIEFGIALAQSMKVFLIGPKTTVFHNLPEVQHFANLQSFYAAHGWKL